MSRWRSDQWRRRSYRLVRLGAARHQVRLLLPESPSLIRILPELYGNCGDSTLTDVLLDFSRVHMRWRYDSEEKHKDGEELCGGEYPSLYFRQVPMGHGMIFLDCYFVSDSIFLLLC